MEQEPTTSGTAGLSARARLEEIAAAAVLADPSDTDSIAELRKQLRTLKSALAPDRAEHAPITTCLEQLEAVTAGDPEQADLALAAVGAAVAEMQRSMRADPPGEPAEPIAEPKTAAELQLADWLQAPIFRDFLATQVLELVDLEHMIRALEPGGDPEQSSIEAQAELKGRLHTLEGDAGIYGLEDVEHVCHAVEGPLDDLDALPPGVADQLLGVRDWMGQAFQAYSDGRLPPTRAAEVAEALAAWARGGATSARRARKLRTPPARQTRSPRPRSPHPMTPRRRGIRRRWTCSASSSTRPPRTSRRPSRRSWSWSTTGRTRRP